MVADIRLCQLWHTHIRTEKYCLTLDDHLTIFLIRIYNSLQFFLLYKLVSYSNHSGCKFTLSYLHHSVTSRSKWIYKHLLINQNYSVQPEK